MRWANSHYFFSFIFSHRSYSQEGVDVRTVPLEGKFHSVGLTHFGRYCHSAFDFQFLELLAETFIPLHNLLITGITHRAWVEAGIRNHLLSAAAIQETPFPHSWRGSDVPHALFASHDRRLVDFAPLQHGLATSR